MNDLETPGWFGPVVGIVAAIAGLWGLWCTVIAFIGGTMPLLGIETDGGLVPGLLMLFIGEPILMTVTYWVAMLILMPLALLFSRRTS